MKKEKDKDKEKKKKRVKKTSRSQQKETSAERTRRTRPYTSSALKKSRQEKENVSREPAVGSLPSEPLEYFLQAVGGKWKMRILWALREEGSLRYRLIRDTVTGITDMMLSQSLRELTECGLTIRRQFQEIPPRVEYEITEAGRALLPIFQSLLEWEKRFRPLLEERRLGASESKNQKSGKTKTPLEF